jgi:hypothetical protein
VKRRVTAVRVLLRIERHLRRILRQQQPRGGAALTVGEAAAAGVSETTIRGRSGPAATGTGCPPSTRPSGPEAGLADPPGPTWTPG